ncbi:MAG: CTP synthase, partial [Alphaproteobacteria bacterium]
VKELRSIGIQPDILLCRSEKTLSDSDRDKIALFCNIPAEKVILGLDHPTIYNAMLDYHERGLAKQTLKHFNIRFNKNSFKLDKWFDILHKLENPIKEVRIAVVGKYMKLKDSYKSLIEALTHAGIHHQHKVKIVWINAAKIKLDNVDDILKDVQGILVPGGFGDRDVTGKILAIKYAREKKVPFFGICLGMQLATIEFARNVLKIGDANSTEFSKKCTKIIAMMTEWEKDGFKQKRKSSSDLGGTMRLGAFECAIEKGTLAHKIYGVEKISERHRHRYEFNIYWREQFEKAGLVFSGMSPNAKLTEIVEIKEHPWFVGVQFHPELKSKAFAPHPLFTSFIKQAIMYIK